MESYFYNCSKEYLSTISPALYSEVQEIVSNLPKRSTQSEVNQDLFWTLTSKGWSYHAVPSGLDHSTPTSFPDLMPFESIMQGNKGDLCLTTTTLEARWRADFAKQFGGKLVQAEAQFGKVEAMFKDFCGFQIAHF